MKIIGKIVASVFVLFFLVYGSNAHEYRTGTLMIDHPHLVKPLPGVNVSAGYVKITNNGTQIERLVGLTTEFAEKAELHNVKIIDGVAKMRPVKGGITIPPGETVELRPGSLHLMFIGVAENVDVGQLRAVKLLFEKAGIVEVEMIVLDPADLEHDDGEDSHTEHTH